MICNDCQTPRSQPCHRKNLKPPTSPQPHYKRLPTASIGASHPPLSPPTTTTINIPPHFDQNLTKKKLTSLIPPRLFHLIFQSLPSLGIFKREMAQTFSAEELKKIYDFALDLGRRAGRILIDGVGKRTGDAGSREQGGGEQKEKMNAVDIVTQTDLGT